MMQTYTVYKQFLCVFQYSSEYCVSDIFVFSTSIQNFVCIYIYIVYISYMYINFHCSTCWFFYWKQHCVLDAISSTCFFAGSMKSRGQRVYSFVNFWMVNGRRHTHIYILHWVNPGVRETMNYFNNIIMFFSAWSELWRLWFSWIFNAKKNHVALPGRESMHNANFAQWLCEAQGTTDFFFWWAGFFSFKSLFTLGKSARLFFFFVVNIPVFVGSHSYLGCCRRYFVCFIFVRGDSCLPKLQVFVIGWNHRSVDCGRCSNTTWR